MVGGFQTLHRRSICEYLKYDHYTLLIHSYHLKSIAISSEMHKKVNIYILDYAN